MSDFEDKQRRLDRFSQKKRHERRKDYEVRKPEKARMNEKDKKRLDKIRWIEQEDDQ